MAMAMADHDEGSPSALTQTGKIQGKNVCEKWDTS